ncbi:hypothetical protein ACP70R_004772 [Stipagrostis hirtigluma subsp. patula]
MSRFGRSGPPPIRDTYSLLVLNITFRTTADDLFPLFDKYGEVVDIYIPRDRRTGDSRGFAFVRYKYEDEAQKAVDRLDGRVVDGREIMVQFAKYGPNAERIAYTKQPDSDTLKIPTGWHPVVMTKGELWSHFQGQGAVPEAAVQDGGLDCRSLVSSGTTQVDYGYRDDYRDDYRRDRDYRRRSRSRSRDRYGRDRYRDRDYRRRSRSRSYSPDDSRKHGRDSLSPARRSPSRSRSRSYSPDDYKSRGKDRSPSPASRSPSHSPRRTPPSPEGSPVRRNGDQSPRSRSPSN